MKNVATDVCQRSSVPVHVGLTPGFSEEVLEETGKYRIFRDGDGVVKQVFKSGKDSIPHYNLPSRPKNAKSGKRSSNHAWTLTSKVAIRKIGMIGKR